MMMMRRSDIFITDITDIMTRTALVFESASPWRYSAAY
jgi:hypothetical protein